MTESTVSLPPSLGVLRGILFECECLVAERDSLRAKVEDLQRTPLNPVFASDPLAPPVAMPSDLGPVIAQRDFDGLARRFDGIWKKWCACARERDDLKAIFGIVRKGFAGIAGQINEALPVVPEGEPAPEPPSPEVLLALINDVRDRLAEISAQIPEATAPPQIRNLKQPA